MQIKIKCYIPILLILLLSSISIHGQETDKKLPLKQVLDEISTLHIITFNYESSYISDIKVFPPPTELKLSSKIANLEKQTNLVFKRVSNLVITISKPIKLCGYIKDASLQQPIPGATINGISAYSITDDNGYFELELNSLEELLTVKHLGFKTIKREVKYFNLEQCGSLYMLEQHEQISAVLIDAYLVKGIDIEQDWTTSVDYDKFSLLPGLIESDVLQTVQALPSILSVDETVSNINIRGGSNDQNLILWDDIKMYQTGHFFGLISSFNPQMTQTASIINNGSDVSLNDGVSGTIHMKTESKLNTDFEGIIGANFLNAELFSNIPLGKKSSLQVASRKSLDEFVRTPTYDVYFNRITQNTEAEENTSEVTNSNQDFNFYDASLRWLHKLSDKELIRLNFTLASNDLSFNETANVEDISRTRQSSVSQNSLAFGFNYKRQWSNKFNSTFNIYNSDYELQAKNVDILAGQLFLQKNRVSETSLKLENVFKTDLWQHKLGYSFTETEVINLNDIDQPRFVRRDEEVLREHGAFLQTWFNNNSFSIRGGIRANYITKYEKLLIEPRFSIRKAISENFEIEALGEYKHQNTSQIINFQNDFLGIEKRRWQLTDNDTIPIIRSKQASIGLLYKNKGWLFDAKAYYKTVDGITTQSQSFTTKYESAREKGSYDVYGFELLFRKQFKNLSSWLSYSYINNTYTFENLEEIEFPSNFDITHSFTFGTTYSNNRWNISAGLNYRLGKPTSIPLADNEVIDNEVNYDEANNERLVDYMRIDASALYKFMINKTFRSEIGASVWNIEDRENTINNYYRVNNISATQFSRYSLGITSNIVFRLYF
ncbi:TonB-dependent receptor [Winogradskyella echinorum]|uniref:TonB-dependent receptor n=1 Tax=Winogradskyella echinorum TaxID=538189 RepID=A0ABR6Y051_9FLAO|nr:TonB-dependent receptor [Winogradskyella echinorum]MBC3845630.1 TonB-dependent receptor [Winogradskyella echinorum]MBC5749978.1 TonB-dependent receptor [Winogradskyella echinorum]